MKIGIVGAGAVGGVLAALLTAKGYDVELTYRHKKDVLIDNMVPIEITGELGSLSYLVKTVPQIEDFSSKKDAIFILTRADEAAIASKRSLPHLTPTGKIVVNTNVWVADEVFAVVPKGRVVGLFISWASERTANNAMRVYKKGIGVLGMFTEKDKEALESLKTLLSSVMPTTIQDNMYGFVASRVIINSAISALGAVSGLKLGKILKNRHGKSLFLKLVEEGYLVFSALKIKIPNYAGKLKYDLFVKKSMVNHFYREKIISLIIKNNSSLVPSSLLDLQRGVKTEMRYLSGKVAQLGEKINIKTPFSANITEMVDEIENSIRSVCEDNFEALFQRIK